MNSSPVSAYKGHYILVEEVPKGAFCNVAIKESFKCIKRIISVNSSKLFFLSVKNILIKKITKTLCAMERFANQFISIALL